MGGQDADEGHDGPGDPAQQGAGHHQAQAPHQQGPARLAEPPGPSSEGAAGWSVAGSGRSVVTGAGVVPAL